MSPARPGAAGPPHRLPLQLVAPGAPTLRVGSVLDLGTYRLGREEIVAFALEWDPMRIHVDEEFARSQMFGGLIASGMHTWMTVARAISLQFSSVYPVLAGCGWRHLRLLAPVRPDVPFSATLTIESITARDELRADVVLAARAEDHTGVAVLTMTGDLLATYSMQAGAQQPLGAPEATQ